MDKHEKTDSPNEVYEFCKKLPKVELHAHLNGSLSPRTLQRLVELQSGDAPVRREDLHKYVCTDGRDWKTLAECFGIAHRLTQSPASITLATRLTVEEFADDGVIYLELRSSPKPCPTRRAYIDAVLEGIKSVTTPDIIAKYIISVDRSWPLAVIREVTSLSVEYHSLYPHLVAGVDLSGDPSQGRYGDIAVELRRARDNGLKTTIHCGEVANREEVSQILSSKPDRVGHAVCVHGQSGGDDSLWRQLLDTNTCVEVCLTSNVVTGSVASYNCHHVRHLESHGAPFVICTDDAGVFATSLAREYAHYARVCRADYRRLARLSRDSLGHCFVDEDTRGRLARRIQQFTDAYDFK